MLLHGLHHFARAEVEKWRRRCEARSENAGTHLGAITRMSGDALVMSQLELAARWYVEIASPLRSAGEGDGLLAENSDSNLYRVLSDREVFT